MSVADSAVLRGNSDGAIPAPDILDLLIVGGGPAGTAAAFRAKELGLRALVIDFDDLLKRIRDYPKDKLILPDFGGGDAMSFPAGGDCIASLPFPPIDKDDLCATWQAHYRAFDVPAQTGIELTGLERLPDSSWNAVAWNHTERAPAAYRARHVVVAVGRGVPRRFDIAGNTDGIAYRLEDPKVYVQGPVCVIGGGTSAAEAVIAISKEKARAEDPCPVYWSYRGVKMPRISKALADEFFETYVGNGNIRYYPESEPVAIVTAPDRTEQLSVRVDRKALPGRPVETIHLEFPKTNTIACIGEDIPESFLRSLGIHMVAAGAGGKKMMLLTPLLETQQPNLYLIGDLLSQSYLETDDFAAPPDTYRHVKHRGNIKSSLRDGVFVAEVIKQRLEGRHKVEVIIHDAEPAPALARDRRVTTAVGKRTETDEDAATPAGADTGLPARAYLMAITPVGIEAEQFTLPATGAITIGRTGCDINFPLDTLLSESHASISCRNGEYILRDDGSLSGTYLRIRSEPPTAITEGDLIRLGRQILVIDRDDGCVYADHYDEIGRALQRYTLPEGTTVFGRPGGRSDPDVTLDPGDLTLSRFHMSVTLSNGQILVQDFQSRNGTYLAVEAERKLEHDDVLRVGSQQFVLKLREDLPTKTGSFPVISSPPATREPEGAAAPPPPAPTLAPHVAFIGQAAGPIDPAETVLQWADAHDIAIDYECWSGMCGCDVVRVVEGAQFVNAPTEKEIKTLARKGLEPGPCRLACMTRVSGPVVLEVVE